MWLKNVGRVVPRRGYPVHNKIYYYYYYYHYFYYGALTTGKSTYTCFRDLLGSRVYSFVVPAAASASRLDDRPHDALGLQGGN